MNRINMIKELLAERNENPWSSGHVVEFFNDSRESIIKCSITNQKLLCKPNALRGVNELVVGQAVQFQLSCDVFSPYHKKSMKVIKRLEVIE